MREFDKISIQEMSKEDMLMIIEALEYNGNIKQKLKDLIDLKNKHPKRIIFPLQKAARKIF